MKILIEIPEELYESAKNESYTSIDEYDAIKAIANGRLIDADDKEIP